VNINSNTSNLNQLSKAISGVKSGEICIASGWIRSNTLKEVLGGAEKAIRSGKVSLRLILRAGDPVDLKITDSYVFSYLEDLKADALKRSGSVELRYSAKHHAKLYVAGEKAAMIGSYNLTGGGFGTEDRPGSNPEAGVFFDDPQGIADVQASINTGFELLVFAWCIPLAANTYRL
jgi:phosphatidylserine/phosphatidylglycerophosphate/cardiolipin synthase-like enzyme